MNQNKTIFLLILSTIFLLICVGVVSAGDGFVISSDRLLTYLNFTYGGEDSRNYSNFTLYNQSYITTDGLIGNGVMLNGSSSLIMNKSTNLFNNINLNYSVSLWVKANTSGQSADLINFEDRIGIISMGSNTFSLMAYQLSDSSNVYTYMNPLVIEPQRWYHIVAIYNGTYLLIYVNGIKSKTVTACTTPYNGKDRNTSIGARFNGGSNFFNGTIDEVAIFNRSLTETEVKALYNNGQGNQYADGQFQEIPLQTEFYFSNNGNDSAWCNQTNPCATVYKMNSLALSPGNTVYFERGGFWRMTTDAFPTILKSGNSSHMIRYLANGTGRKPLFYGSWNGSNSSDWLCDGTYCTMVLADAYDIGNIYFNVNTNTTFAYNKSNLSTNLGIDLAFYFNTTNKTLYLKTTTNPVTRFPNGIELADRRSDEDEAVIYFYGLQNIEVANWSIKYESYGAVQAHENVKNITVRDMDIAWIGGAIQAGTVRYGNCISGSLNESKLYFVNNNVTQCYDACYSFQSWSSAGDRYMFNLTLQNNIGTYCHYGFEFFSSRTTTNSNSSDIIIDHNTLLHIGEQWSLNQRYTTYPAAGAFELSRNSKESKRFNVTNNIIQSNNNSINLGLNGATNWDNSELIMDKNYYYITQTTQFADWLNTLYTSLNALRAVTTNETLSFSGNPLFANADAGDYRPTNGTACFMGQNGTYVGAVACDYNGNYTITLNRSGQIVLNYPKIKNVSYMEGDVIAFGRIPTNYSLYNVTRGETVFTHSPTFTLRVNPNEQYEVSEEGTCLYIMNGFRVNRTTTFCSKYYNCAGTIDGCIIINQSNVKLFGNGAILNGSNNNLSRGIVLNINANNTNITGFTFYNYGHAIGRNFSDSSARIINISIYNNTFYDSNNHTINADGYNNSEIFNNIFYNSTYNAIRIHSNHYVNVYNNLIYANDSTYSGIFYDGRHNYIYDNTIYIKTSGVYAIRSGADSTQEQIDNKVYNNNLYGGNNNYGFSITPQTPYQSGTQITGNLFSAFTYGVANLGNTTNISGNTFENCQYGVYVSSGNSNNLISNNVLNNATIRIDGATNNSFSSNTFNILRHTYRITATTNFTVLQSVNYLILNNSNQNSYLRIYSNGLKNITYINNVSTLGNSTLNYWIFNNTQSEPAVSNVATYDVNLGKSNRTLVYQFETSTQPYPTYISTNISEMTYDLSADGKTLTISCTGSGQVPWNMTNLIGGLGGNTQAYYYINGVYTATIYTNDVGITSCSTHTFTASALASITDRSGTIAGTIGAYNGLIALFGLIIAVVVCVIALVLIKGGDGIKEMFDFKTTVLILVVVAVLIVVGILILEALPFV